MANAVIKYAESLTGSASTTAWVDVASLANTEFEANKTYLIIANQICTAGSASDEIRVRLVHGTTPTVFDDASLAYEGIATDMRHEESYLFLYTQPATAELVKLQISSSSTTTVTNRLSQILAIKLSDDFISGTDYFWNEFLTNYTMTSTPTAKAITSSFTPNGTDRWLFVGHMIYDVVTITAEIGFELYDSVAGVLNMVWQEGEDATNDFHGHNAYWVGVPTNAARTLAVRAVNEAGSNVMLASRVFAFNLSKFAQSISTFDAAEVDPATTPTYTTLATVAPAPNATGDWVYLAFTTQDINESAGLATRLQVNPDGVGLISDPDYPTTVPGNDFQDALDETGHAIFKLRQLNSGAARTINFDARRTAGTLGRFEDNGLVAFSVALAGGGFQDGAGASTGTATPTGVGSSLVDSSGLGTAAATVLAVGAALISALGVSDGVATPLGVGSSLFDVPGISAGVATVSGAGSALSDSPGSSAGVATVSGAGSALADSPGSSAGVATVSGVGEAIAESGAESSSGVATVSGAGSALSDSPGSSSGVATVSGAGSSLSDSPGSSAGVATVSGAGSSLSDSPGSSAGVATVSGAGSALADSPGSSAGVATVSGIGDSVGGGGGVFSDASGSSSGVSTVIGVGLEGLGQYIVTTVSSLNAVGTVSSLNAVGTVSSLNAILSGVRI